MATAGPTPALPPPSEALIAYAVSSAIHVAEADGSNDQFLAPGSSPSWSPDGQWLAYACQPADAVAQGRLGDICVMAADGSAKRVLIRDGIAPRWSPAGNRIAFARSPIDLGDTWVARSDGSGVVNVPGGSPSWSPDGSWLLVLTGSGSPIVDVVRPDGSDFRELGPGWNATWSPDGSRIASSWCGGSSCQIVAVEISDGSREELFTTRSPVSALLWLPGDRVAYAVEDGDLFLVDLGTGKARPLTDGLAVRGPLVISPGADRIAFAAGRRGGDSSDLYAASLAADTTRLTRSGDSREPAWQPTPP